MILIDLLHLQKGLLRVYLGSTKDLLLFQSYLGSTKGFKDLIDLQKGLLRVY